MVVLGVKVDDDVDLSKYSISVMNNGYLQFRKDGKCTLLHRMIMGLGAEDKRTVDHIDGDKLNNMRSNLRMVTHQQNRYNKGLY